jgi:xylulokinase
MARTLVAGVDTSTQSCKVRVTDAETGELVRFGQAKHPNGTSVDPSYWWSAFQEAAEQAGGLDDVSALAVGGDEADARAKAGNVAESLDIAIV